MPAPAHTVPNQSKFISPYSTLSTSFFHALPPQTQKKTQKIQSQFLIVPSKGVYAAYLVQDFPSQLATKAYPKGLVLGGNCRATPPPKCDPRTPLPKNLRVVNCELSLDMAGNFRKGLYKP